MSPIIRVDDQVYAWLQSKARPFEDTPNSVLRHLAGFGAAPAEPAREKEGEESPPIQVTESARQTPQESPMLANVGVRLTGDLLARRWKVSVRHALYHRDGTWYNNLRRFPGALFDPHGYVVFKTEDDYRNSPYVSVGAETNVRPHISAIPGYVVMEK